MFSIPSWRLPRKSLLASIIVLTLCMSAVPFVEDLAPAKALQNGSPLVFMKDGDLWSWTPGTSAPVQLTTWGYNERPVISPDGTRVAYNSWATITVEALQAGKPVVGLIPSNIWVLDIATANGTRVADQPPDARFLSDSEMTDKVIMRGKPEWSPDGTRLAWAELLIPESTYRLMVYDFTTQTTQVLVTQLPRPFADGGFIPIHELDWANSGIALLNGAYSDESAQFKQTLYVYDANGVLTGEFEVGSADGELLYDYMWIAYDGTEHLGLFYRTGNRVLVNPTARTDFPMPGIPELYTTRQQSSAFTAAASPAPDQTGEFDYQWATVTPDRSTTAAFQVEGGRANVAIAPDGSAVAYWRDALYVLTAGSTVKVPGTEGISSGFDVGVVWSYTAWRVAEDIALDLSGTVSSPSSPTGPGDSAGTCGPAPRLTVGAPGRVLPGLPNIIRDAPGDSAGSVVGRIPGTGVFTVLNGPICSPDGRYWWQVDYQGLIGWTPEGEGQTYWLEPYAAGQPANQIVCSPAPRLMAGSVGYVLPGTPNILRDAPKRGIDSHIVGQIPGGALFTVVSGPRCGPEGRFWWQINYQGTVAWTPEGDYSTYWLAPYGCTNSPTPRLQTGMGAYVLPGDPNTLRSQPNASSGAIGQIPGGDIFGVIGGPVCGPEGWTWWRVDYRGQIGWTAEGSGATYWLSPLPTDVGAPVTACTLAPRLQVGMMGRITPGRPNAVRTRAGTGSDSAVIGEIPAGGSFRVLEGPVCGNDGRQWWRVSYYNLVGWTAEGEGSTYWLEPDTGPVLPTPVSPVGCFLTPRLQAGRSAYVTPGAANAIRSLPTRLNDSVVVGEIPGGAFFQVLSGPVCGPEGRYWWQINYQGILGWTAEGERTEYWTGVFQCANSQVTRLVPGGTGRVTPGDPNILRDRPGTGTSSLIIGSIPGRGIFTVVGGPQCGNDGRVWWQVNYGGQIGWTPEGDASNYWLEPLS